MNPPGECPDTPCACHYMTDGDPDCILVASDNLETCYLVYNGTLNCDCSGDCASSQPSDDWWRCNGNGTCCHAGVDNGCASCDDQDSNCYKGYMASSLCSNNCSINTTSPPDDWWRCNDGTCCHAGVDGGCDPCDEQDLNCYRGNSAESDCNNACVSPTTASPTTTTVPTTTLEPSYSNCADACIDLIGPGSQPTDPSSSCCNGCIEDIYVKINGSFTTCACCYCNVE